MTKFTRSDHDRALAPYMGSPHWWLVGTKFHHSSDFLHTDAAADLRHDVWIIRTDDPKKVKDCDHTLNFGTSVDVGPATLSEMPSDLLTAKLLALEYLSGRLLSKVSAYGTYLRLNAYFWLVRWRVGLRLRSFSEVTPALLEDFYANLKTGGTLALIPFRERIVELADRVRTGSYHIQTIAKDGRGRGPQVLHMAQLSFDLGLGWQRFTSQQKALIHDVLSTLNLSDDTAGAVSALARSAKTGRSDTSSELHGSDLGIADDLGSDEDASAVRVVSEHTARMYLGSLQSVYDLSRLALLNHDPLPFNPFADVSFYRRVWTIARPSGRTPTIAPSQWLALLDNAARWVVELAGPARAIVAAAQRISLEQFARTGGAVFSQSGLKAMVAYEEQLSSEIARQWPTGLPKIHKRWRDEYGSDQAETKLSLDALHYHVIAGAFILIGAFGARRETELVSLREGCAQKDDLEQWWIESYIQKTIRDYDKLPVPASVGAAVRILEELSESARRDHDTPFISTIYRPSAFFAPDPTSTFFAVGITKLMRDFAEISNIPPMPDGTQWQFAAHQLRRAFSIFYYYGYRYANLDALSRFLRHFDPEMTRRYITEVIPGLLAKIRERRKAALAIAQEGDRAAALAIDAEFNLLSQRLKDISTAFTEVKEGATVELVMAVYDGSEQPIGRGAQTLYRDLEGLIELARADVRIASPNSNAAPEEVRDALVSQAQTYAKTKNFEPVPNKINCGFSPKRKDKPSDALCLQRKASILGTAPADAHPDYDFADHPTCLACLFGSAFSWGQEAVDQSIATAASAAERAPSADTRTAAQRRLDSLKEQAAAAAAVTRTR